VIIGSAEELFQYADQNLKIQEEHKNRRFFYLSKKDLKRKETKIQLNSLKGTRSLHAIRSAQNGGLLTRNLSCYCLKGCILGNGNCEHKDYARDWVEAAIKESSNSTGGKKSDIKNVKRTVKKSVGSVKTAVKKSGVTNAKTTVKRDISPRRWKLQLSLSASPSAKRVTRSSAKRTASPLSKEDPQKRRRTAPVHADGSSNPLPEALLASKKSTLPVKSKSDTKVPIPETDKREPKKTMKEDTIQDHRQQSFLSTRSAAKRSASPQHEQAPRKRQRSAPPVHADSTNPLAEALDEVSKSSFVKSKSTKSSQPKTDKKKPKKTLKENENIQNNSYNKMKFTGPIPQNKVKTITADLIHCPFSVQYEKVICMSVEPLVPREELSVVGLGGIIDKTANDLLNGMNDVPGIKKYPMMINGDGNCLPRCGSVLAYGTEDFHADIRLRIAMELIEHKSVYMDSSHLQKGLHPSKKKPTAAMYAQFSDFYTFGDVLTPETVNNIYEKEVNAILKNKMYCGIWQVFALSSILQLPIFSTYPNKGTPAIRNDLHRIIHPRENAQDATTPMFIMWTSTRTDMQPQHWVPNHFDLLLPLVVIRETAVAPIYDYSAR
jgi:hypothetical protein